MAVPARRKSSTRIKKGRGPKSWSFQQKALNQPLIKCASCQKTKILHHLCSRCSVYRTNSNSQPQQRKKHKIYNNDVKVRNEW